MSAFKTFVPILMLTAAVSPAPAEIRSSFDTDPDGWVVVSIPAFGPFTTPLATNAATFSACGYVQSEDPTTVTSFWQAPARFLGDRSSSYGLTLEWDVRVTPIAGKMIDASPEVVLVGAGLTLVIDAGPAPPPDVWTHFRVTLDERVGWRKESLAGVVPTPAEFQATLASLTALRLCGEYVEGPEVDALDNVVLNTAADAPPVAGLAIWPAVEIGWPTLSNQLYQVQWAAELDTNRWFNLGSPIRGDGATNSLFDSTRGGAKKFYRVLLLN